MKKISVAICGGLFLLSLVLQLCLAYYFLPAFADVGMTLSLPLRVVVMALPWLIAVSFVLTAGCIASFWYEIRWVAWCQNKTMVAAVFVVGVLLTALAAVGITAPLFDTVTPVGR